MWTSILVSMTGYKFTVVHPTETGTNVFGAKDMPRMAWAVSVIGGSRRVNNSCLYLS